MKDRREDPRLSSSTKSPSSNDGKKAEKYVQAALTFLERYNRCAWVRLYDSTSAGFGGGGNLIPPQPGDFICAFEGIPALLEVKSSIKHTSLSDTTLRDMFKDNQIMGARVWQRADSKALCLFYTYEGNGFELWDMQPIVEAYLQPPRKRKLLGKPLAVCTPEAQVLGHFLATLLHQER